MTAGRHSSIRRVGLAALVVYFGIFFFPSRGGGSTVLRVNSSIVKFHASLKINTKHIYLAGAAVQLGN